MCTYRLFCVNMPIWNIAATIARMWDTDYRSFTYLEVGPDIEPPPNTSPSINNIAPQELSCVTVWAFKNLVLCNEL